MTHLLLLLPLRALPLLRPRIINSADLQQLLARQARQPARVDGDRAFFDGFVELVVGVVEVGAVEGGHAGGDDVCDGTKRGGSLYCGCIAGVVLRSFLFSSHLSGTLLCTGLGQMLCCCLGWGTFCCSVGCGGGVGGRRCERWVVGGW